METINDIELTDESIYPDEAVLERVLGASFGAYRELLKLYADEGLVYEWRYYRDGKAWLCKVQKGKKTVVWMSAWRGYMQATVYLPLSLLEGVYSLNLDKAVAEKIRTTKNVGKSKPCIFEVRDASALPDLAAVMRYKMGAK